METENGRSELQNHAASIRQLRKMAAKAEKKVRTKLLKQQNELEEAKNWQWFQQVGDSLLADPDAYPKGEAEREIINVHTQRIEIVRLNPKCDAYRNAELYYKKARKGKRGFEASSHKVEDSKKQIAQIQQFISDCETLIERVKVGESVNEQTLNQLSEKGKQFDSGNSLKASGGGKKVPKIPYRHYRVDEYDVYIGKTDAQNDELSTRFARSWDVWLHVAGHAGSHVVIQRQKGSQWPPQKVIEKAGAMAVWFSKARHTSYAEVHVTEARYVSKPRKSPPGQVQVQRFKTVRVAPKSPHEMFPGIYE